MTFSRLPADLPDSLARPLAAQLEEERPTVVDARQLLAPYQTDIIELVVDDGQRADQTKGAVYLDVVDAGDLGLGLKLRGLMSAVDPAVRRTRERELRSQEQVLPLALVVELPEAFRFLRRPRETWPMPPLFVACERCGHGSNTGRFCGRCGLLVRGGKRPDRKGRWSDFCGLAFRAEQKVLRRQGGRPCTCGAVLAPFHRFCPKCGREPRGTAEGRAAQEAERRSAARLR